MQIPKGLAACLLAGALAAALLSGSLTEAARAAETSSETDLVSGEPVISPTDDVEKTTDPETDPSDSAGSKPVADRPQKTVVVPAAPQKLAVKATSRQGIRISWEKVPKAVKYEVYRADKKDGSYRKIATVKKTRLTQAKCRQLKAYYYKVRAVDKKGAKGPFSKIKRVVVLPKYPTPKLADATASTVTLRWDANKKVNQYVVYRAKKRNGNYKRVGTTKKTEFKDKKLKSKHTYYYRVYAVGRSLDGKTAGVKSACKTVKATTKKTVSRTVYIGDSVMQGVREYHVINNGNGKKVVTKIGISPSAFVNSGYMTDVLNYNPDRVFIMIGLNAIEGHPGDAWLDRTLGYTEQIIGKVLKKNPEAQVVLLPVAPVRPGASASQAVIDRYNKKQEKLAESLGIYYYDFTGPISDSTGHLRAEYCDGDRIHWKISCYRVFKDLLDSYGKTLD